MDLRVDGNHNSQYGFDNLELYRCIALLRTLANGFNDGIYQESIDAAIFWLRSVFRRVYAVVWTPTVEELISEELLDAVNQPLHESRYPRLDTHL